MTEDNVPKQMTCQNKQVAKANELTLTCKHTPYLATLAITLAIQELVLQAIQAIQDSIRDETTTGSGQANVENETTTGSGQANVENMKVLRT